MEKRTSFRRTLALSLLLIAAAQFSLSPLAMDFRISVAVTCFSAAIYFLEDVSVFPVTLLTAAGTFLTRTLLYYAKGEDVLQAMVSAGPEIVFFLIYGTGLWVYARSAARPLHRPVFLCFTAGLDLLSNLGEIAVRPGLGRDWNRTILVLVAAAVFRTILLWGILAFFDRYRLVLLKRSNAERYQRLLLLMSRLGGEVTWMGKNAGQVEQVMNESYDLYRQLQGAGDEETAAKALSVAKDIHEIKKEYLLIMRGLSEAMEEERTQEGMELPELLLILRQSVQKLLADSERTAEIRIDCPDRLYVREIYPLLSVFRNLISNAVEAGGTVIDLREEATSAGWRLSVSDNGPGIPPEDLDRLFSPGFSTKINYETGVVARGLGLPIVQDIVEHTLHGRIAVDTGSGGTTFSILLPKDEWEVLGA